MTPAEYFVDRKKLSGQITFWRVATIVAAVVAVLALGLRFSGALSASSEHIARVEIKGLITGDERTLKVLRDVADSKAAAAIISINSPGGTTEGSEVLYEEIRRLAAKKPTVAVAGAMAASGAYIAALGADRIFAHGNSLVGSIGVLVQYPNVSGLMDKLGVKLESIKSSPLKAAPNGLEPTSDEARAAMAALVADSFSWFKGLVRTRRGLTDDELAKVSDGRVFTGREGASLKLVDALGGQREAIAWLETEKGVAKDLPVRDWEPESSFAGLRLTSLAAAALGAPSLAAALREASDEAGGSVDGLMSVWQVSSRN